jgi:hypothetical protein
MLALPTSALRQLGLDAPTVVGWQPGRPPLYGPVRLRIFDRDMVLDAIEVEDGRPVLIGQLPLEHMQLVVDMENHRLAKSPANGGEWVLDMF